jgi:hypothetical protein
MPKHKRKHSESLPQALTKAEEIPREEENELTTADLPPIHSLATIRANALNTDADTRATLLEIREKTAQTITELEGWRDEIERTIAFLKARR